MILTRPPRPSLRPFLALMWSMDEGDEKRVGSRSRFREHVLPTGRMHLAMRLTDDPLRVFADEADDTGRTIGTAVVGGARASFYIREVAGPLSSVGAQLLPGAAEALFGVPAGELAGRHTPLDDVWSASLVAEMRERLAVLPSASDRLEMFEAMLAARLPRVRGLHPAVAQALEQIGATAHVRDLVAASGYSHRTFTSLFTRSVGLGPKTYARVLRFQRALRHASRDDGEPWAALAADLGYSDQPHFVREFRAFTGVTPTEYRAASPRFTHHLAVSGARSRR